MRFYYHYVFNATKKNRFRGRLMMFVCAGAVAFAAMCSGYLSGYSSMQSEYLKNISARELIVFNETFTDNPFVSSNEAMTQAQVEHIEKIEEIEAMSPIVAFHSSSAFFNEFSLPNSGEPEGGISRITIKNNAGFIKSFESDPWQNDADDNQTLSYTVQSYPIEHYYDSRCSVLDLSVLDGVYLSEQFASRLGIDETVLSGLAITMTVWVPVSIIESDSIVTVYEPEESTFVKKSDNYYMIKTELTVPVRGMFPLLSGDEKYITGDVFMQSQEMIEIILNNVDAKNTGAQSFANEWNRYFYSNADEHNYNYRVKSWTPNAFSVIAKSLSDVDIIKAQLESINPNFTVIQEYQDIEASSQILHNNRNVMLYISFAVLAVALLLMALIYVSLIDRRKFEFAVLRANGFTKKEVRKLIYTEMLWQFLKIFLFGIICATLIYLIGRVWLGYPFQFDGMTALWVFVISLGSIILPTIISLLFVNKFEPDQVMRN